MAKKHIKVEAYSLEAVNIKNNRKQSNFDFRDWINKADEIGIEGRVFPHYTEKARLEHIFFEKDLWCLSFDRLRDTNLPIKTKLYEESTDIEIDEDEYIGDKVAMLYDPTNHIVILQRNRNSLSLSGIQQYINKLWNNERDLLIQLNPILEVDPFIRAGNKQTYKKMKVKLADMLDQSLVANENKPFKKICDLLTGYSGMTAEIVISMGQTRGKYLDDEMVKETMEILKDNENLVKGAEISYKGDDDKTEVVDLFNNKVFDIISVDLETRRTIPIEEIRDKMIISYRGDFSEKIKRALRR